MTEKVCRHPSSEKNFTERREQDILGNTVIWVYRRGDPTKIDDIPLKTAIHMHRRRTGQSYRKDLRKNPFYISEVALSGLILING